ncbi:MAG: hypothetical protein ACREBD_05745 [Blastocatellia bacterium]
MELNQRCGKIRTASSAMKSKESGRQLEDELQSILNAALPVIYVGSADRSEAANAGAGHRVAASAKDTVRRSYVGSAHNRVGKVWLVESIQRFQPQLNLHAFPQTNVFLDCQINVLIGVSADVGKPQGQSSQVTDRRRKRAGRIQNRGERRGIEPTIGALLAGGNRDLTTVVEKIAKRRREAALERSIFE